MWLRTGIVVGDAIHERGALAKLCVEPGLELQAVKQVRVTVRQIPQDNILLLFFLPVFVQSSKWRD